LGNLTGGANELINKLTITTNGEKINCLRIWAEGYANTSDALLGILPEASTELAIREQQPFEKIGAHEPPEPPFIYNLNTYDRNQDAWENSAYYQRLVSIMDKAQEKNVIVVFTLVDGCVKHRNPTNTAWNPNNNSQISAGFGYGDLPPADEDDSLFPYWYCIFKDRDNPDPNSLNNLGNRQKAYILRMVRTLKKYDNVIFEIMNEPVDFPWGSGLGTVYQRAAQWHWAVCQWILAEDPDRIIAYNHFNEYITQRLQQISGALGQIGVFTIHASDNNLDIEKTTWLTSYNGGCTPESADAHTACGDNHGYWIYSSQHSDAISCARRYGNKAILIDSDGATEGCDEIPGMVLEYARRASIGGAGYVNKTYVANFVDGTLNVNHIKNMNQQIYTAFHTHPSPDYYYNGVFFNSCMQFEESSGTIMFHDEAHDAYTITVSLGPTDNYSITMHARNYGTKEWDQTGSAIYRIYDKYDDSSFSGNLTPAYIAGLADWADISECQSSAPVTFTYNAPPKSCSVTHQYMVSFKQNPNAGNIHFGDILQVTFYINVSTQ